ncbi:MAG: hypothetical protein ACRD4S_12715 [Candidatus Acidiferrales bacterium]
MIQQSPPKILRKFALNVRRASGTLPVRTVDVGSDDDESVRLACRAAKVEEQRILEETFSEPKKQRRKNGRDESF